MQTATSRKAKSTYRKGKKSTPRDLYQEITDKVIAALEAGTIPWQSPNSTKGQRLAYNYVSDKQYRGINFFMLNFLCPHLRGAYLTFNQAKKLGGKIRKGSKSERVYFFKMFYRDADGKPLTEIRAQELKDRGAIVKSAPFLKCTPVFNVTDVEGVDFDLPKIETFEHDPVEAAEDFINKIQNGPAITTAKGNANFYVPASDTVVMYPREMYKTPEAYYQTLFHELTHATGHADRLSREGVTGPIEMGSATYAREELTAEMGAAFLCAKTGVSQKIDNSAAYIDNWLTVLKSDKMLVYKAAAQAQKAVDFLRDSE